MTSADDAATKVFAALADPTRRSLLAMLGRSGGMTAGQLADRLPISRQAIVKHLALAADCGLVRRERHGREVWFAIEPATLRHTARWLDEAATSWGDRLSALRDVAENGAADAAETADRDE